MTYCALLALAVLRDDYALLDRTALARMVGACQAADGGCVLPVTRPLPFLYTAGSEPLIWILLTFDFAVRARARARFATIPGAGDADLRMTYCAFVVCALLDNWSCIDLPRALSYIQRCRVRSVPSSLPLPSPSRPPPLPISAQHRPPCDFILFLARQPTKTLMRNVRARTRRTKADTDRRRRASRSAGRRTARS